MWPRSRPASVICFCKHSNVDLGWIKVQCGEFGQFRGIIGIQIMFLAFGSPLLSSCVTKQRWVIAMFEK